MDSRELHVMLQDNEETSNFFIPSMENLYSYEINEQGLASIHTAAANGQDEILESLIAKGTNINMEDSDGNTCLHFAAKNNRKTTVDLLILKRINLNVRNKKGGYTAISEALDAMNFEVFYKLLNAGANLMLTDDKKYTLLHTACKIGSKEIVEKLVHRHEKLIEMKNETFVTALHQAATYGHLEIVKFLVGRKVDLNAITRAGYTPIMDAVNYNHLDIVKYLFDSGATMEVNTVKGDTVLHFAVRNGNVNMMKYLISKNRNLIFQKNTDGYNALHIAVNQNHFDSVDCLLRSGADVRDETASGTTPLELAASKGNIAIIKILTEYDKDCLNSYTTKGESAIQIALLANHIPVAKHLRQLVSTRKFNFKTKRDYGKTEQCVWRK